MTVASGVIVHAFVVGNYSIKYVQRYSESAQPLGYKLALILIITTISPFSLAFEPYIFSNRDKLEHRTLISRSLTYMVLAAVLASSCLLVLIRFLLPRIAPPEYGSAFLVILMLVPGIIFMGVYYYGQALLNAMNKA